MSAPTTARPVDAEQTGRRVEEAAEELVRSLMDFYGAGLARILHLLSSAPGEPSAGLLADEVVASLLVLHDLHPEDRDTRIARALDSVREHTLDVVDFDEDSGTLRVRARESGGCGCGSGADARQAAEAALACFAPEVKTVDVETAPAGPTLLQISTAPTGAR
jgi:Fe-S cluster biogenesis protein NfuA